MQEVGRQSSVKLVVGHQLHLSLYTGLWPFLCNGSEMCTPTKALYPAHGVLCASWEVGPDNLEYTQEDPFRGHSGLKSYFCKATHKLAGQTTANLISPDSASCPPYTYSEAANMMSRRMVILLSVSLSASSLSPTASAAAASCCMSSSNLRTARTREPSKMSVI